MTKYLFVMLGGSLGAVSRFIVGTLIARWYTGLFPLATFLINVTGSFLIGLLMMLFLNRPSIPANWRLFLVTGILGGYTTFSSFEWEIFATLRGGALAIALSYAVSSLVVGLIGVWAGAILSDRLWPL
jgi:fluoride exporter